MNLARKMLVPVLVTTSLLAAACGGEQTDRMRPSSGSATPPPAATTTPNAGAGCEAAKLDGGFIPQPRLPEPVAHTRQRIIEAALACDLDELARIADEGKQSFTYSFGVGEGEKGDPAAHWRTTEQHGEPVTALLVRLLGTRYARGSRAAGGYYAWPAISEFKHPKATDWAELGDIFPPKELDTMRTMDVYLHYRIGISPSGEWMYFVAGD